MKLQESMQADNVKFLKAQERLERGFWMADIKKGLTPKQLSGAITDDTTKYFVDGYESISEIWKHQKS